MSLKDVLKRAVQTVFPYVPSCVCCGIEKGVNGYVCKNCADKLSELKADGMRLGGLYTSAGYSYQGIAAGIVKGYKYSDKKWLSAFMSNEICKAVFGTIDENGLLDAKTGISDVQSTQSKVNKTISDNNRAGAGQSKVLSVDDFDYICYVPLHKKRRAIRGFDQAEELAKRISELTGIRFISALKRIRNTKTQTKLSDKERRENIHGAFEKAKDVCGNVLLVDDVLTTGATAAECAAVLLKAGAKSVYVATFARVAYGKTGHNERPGN
ncbi:MAG: ComF family protein [Christensenellales bacterium]|jgi:ComF family protein